MGTKRIVLLAATCVLCAGGAFAQTEWVGDPDNPVLVIGDQQSWNAFSGSIMGVTWDGSTYHMIYRAKVDGQDALGHATSADGASWVMDPNNPVLTRGAKGEWDHKFSYGTGALLYDDGEFHLWYGGYDGEVFRVGYATSPDGSVWTKYQGNPVLDAGSPGSFDDHGLYPYSVVAFGGTFRMWFGGIHTSRRFLTIGYAESPDGISWTKHTTPVLEPGEGWDDRDVFGPSVAFDGSMYHMWYKGAGPQSLYGNEIGYAWSSDGIEWSKYAGNPVIAPYTYDFDGNEGVRGESISAWVIYDGSTYHMWCHRVSHGDNHVDYATSDCCAVDRLNRLFVPAAACAAGADGSFYRTDLDLANSGDTAAVYELWWLPRGHDNSKPTIAGTFTLGPGRSVRYTDVLSEVFGLEPNALGALTIVASSPDLLAMSRTYNVAAGESAGTFGQAIPGVSLDEFVTAGERRRILFASENDDLRFNVGCQNGIDKPVTVILELFDSEGTLLERKEMLLQAFGNDQLNRVFADYMPVNGYVDVWSDTGGALFYCYGSVVDNLTNDPMTVLPQ